MFKWLLTKFANLQIPKYERLIEAKKHWKITRDIIKFGTAVKLTMDIDFHYLLNGETLLIYCDETKSLPDILTSIRFKSIEHFGTKYHAGYFSSAILIMTELAKIGLRFRSIKIYGYSLGGSISSILNDIYIEQGTNVIEHVTFGEPANGRGKKLYSLRKNSIRYSQGFDIMTFIMFMYRHYSKVKTLPSRGSIKENHLYYWIK